MLGVGLLQYVLDKGEQLEWFDSSVIRMAGGIAMVALVAMVWREWTHSHPDHPAASAEEPQLCARQRFRISRWEWC